MEWSRKIGRGTVRGGGVKRGGTQIRNDGSLVGREKKMVNEAIRWVDGRERKNVQRPVFTTNYSFV